MKNLDKTLLKSITYFSELSNDELDAIINGKENSIDEFSPRENIFRENEFGEHMYIMLDGLAEVYIKGEQTNRDICIATLKPGDHFGDNSAKSESESRRSATVKVSLPAKVFKIHKKYVLGAINKKPVMPESVKPDDSILKLVKKIPIFYGLSDDEINKLNDWASVDSFQKDDLVYNPGTTAEYLYIVAEGEVHNFVMADDGKKHFISRQTHGQYFGELELLPGGNGKHYQSATVVMDSKIVKIKKSIFDTLLERNKTLAGYIKQMNQLKKLNLTHTEK